MPAPKPPHPLGRLITTTGYALAAGGVAWALLWGEPPVAEQSLCLPYIVRGDSAFAAARAKRLRGRPAADPVYVAHLIVLDTSMRCYAVVLEGDRATPGMMDGTFTIERPGRPEVVRMSSHDLMHDHGHIATRDSARLDADLAACRAHFERPNPPRPDAPATCPAAALP